MRTRLLTICIPLILFTTNGFTAPRSSSPAAVQEKKSTEPVVITAVVKGYQADKTLQLDAGGKSITYDLSQTEVTYKIDPNIRVGGNVRVTDQTDAMGHQTVSVVSVK